jgi:serine/threonine protein phosphatase 1
MPVFAIGDIHGCLTALVAVFEAASISSEDVVVFLGDYVDRGPQSAQVIDWILDRQYPNTFTLRGNHEIMMMEFCGRKSNSNPHTINWLVHGGAETLASYYIDPDDPDFRLVPYSHWVFLNKTLPYYETKDFIFVHAGLKPKVPLKMQLPPALFWRKILDEPLPYGDGRTVICGHTAQSSGEIANFGHTICIDTCVYGGQWLTCLEVESGQYWQANQLGKVREGRLG